MLRDFTAALVIFFASAGAFAADSAVELTGKTLLTSDKVTVGDLFTNTGRHADHVLAPAPAAGDVLTLGKADLKRVATAFNLDWSAPQGDVTVTLERDAYAIDADAISDALAKSNLQSSLSPDASFQLSNIALPIVVDGKAVPELSISDASFDPATEKFSATLKISRHDAVLKEVALTGVATEMVRIPVLLHTLTPGAVISRADLTDMSVAKRDIRANTFLAADALVGMNPKRVLAANRALTESDVTPPLMVKRNELITVVYKNGPILLSSKARSLSAGTRGDIVTLINLNSKKPFEAKITGPQQAEVELASING